MPGEQQQAGDADELVVRELVTVFAHQHAEDVVARLLSRSLNESGHVGPTLPLQFQSLGDRDGQVELSRAALLEVLAVVVGHTEQFADHQRRNRKCEVVHQIHWRT